MNVKAIRKKATELKIDLTFMVVCNFADIQVQTRSMARARNLAYLVPWHQLFVDHAGPLVEELGKTRRPVIYARHQFSAAGGVISMEPTADPEDDRASIDLLFKVLDGRSPADLPVQTPRGFSLYVNATSAASQGLRPSLFLLRRADKILQFRGRH